MPPITVNARFIVHHDGRDKIMMNGSDVFKIAVKEMGNATLKVIEDAGLKPSDISLVVPHQANIRIINAIAKRLELPMEKVIVTVDLHGNTSAASVPLALDAAVRDGRIRAGDTLMLQGVGGGFTWGSALLRW